MKIEARIATALCTVALSMELFASTERAAAGEETTPPASAKEIEPVDVTPDTAERDPFWPIGFDPSQLDTAEVAVVWRPTLAPKKTTIVWPELKFGGRLYSEAKGNSVYVNGIGTIYEGKTVSLVSGGVKYSWKIDAITREKVFTTQIGAKPAK